MSAGAEDSFPWHDRYATFDRISRGRTTFAFACIVAGLTFVEDQGAISDFLSFS